MMHIVDNTHHVFIQDRYLMVLTWCFLKTFSLVGPYQFSQSHLSYFFRQSSVIHYLYIVEPSKHPLELSLCLHFLLRRNAVLSVPQFVRQTHSSHTSPCLTQRTVKTP